MKPNKRTQPMRKGQREPTLALLNAMNGKPVFLPNPMDLHRQRLRAQKILRSLRG